MGEVWSAVHTGLGSAVALKLLTAESARDPSFLLAFRNEVRSAATLDHPNVVAVYDYGELTPLEAQTLGDRMVSGTPWLAMELVSGGTLLPYCGSSDWIMVREVITSMLDALSHAHARGVYHRDLKPANILLGGVKGGGPVKLTDFGLAHAVDGTEDDHFNGGTPSYMAPEQFDGRWRNYGPWTDLYAFGCLLYALITGVPPFGAPTSFFRTRNLHRKAKVPPMEPPFPLPAGFESWLRRLLEKDPARRYRRAADAMYDFNGLPPPTQILAPSRSHKRRAQLDTVKLHSLNTLVDIPQSLGNESHFTIGSTLCVPPPFPANWRRRHTTVYAPMPAGLNLFGLRTVPFVGREAERDLLWERLHHAQAEQSVEMAVIRGASGVGKSRLAQWIGERAHEIGAAILLRATHSPTPDPRDGLAGMISRFLRCDGLRDVQLRSRVHALTGETEEAKDALLALLSPDTLPTQSVGERYVAVTNLIRLASAERPVVLCLEDVHWSADTLRFARHLLETDLNKPIFVLLTATSEHLSAHPDESAVIEELILHEHVRSLDLHPLPSDEHHNLVKAVLELHPVVARQVEEATRGNPSFAVQLIADWIDRDLLVSSSKGYRIRKNRSVVLPADIGVLWERRIERLLQDLSSKDAQALELAGVLGTSVNRQEWRSAARVTGLEVRARLVEAMLHTGLMRASGNLGLVFVSPRLPELLNRRAKESGRLGVLHRACAGVLALWAHKQHVMPATTAERIGRHLLSADEPTPAITYLYQGIVERTHAGEFGLAHNLLCLHRQALTRAAIPPSDKRWGLHELERFQVSRLQGEEEAAARIISDLMNQCIAHGWEEIGVRCAIAHGRMQRMNGERDQAERTLWGAIEVAERTNSPRLRAHAYIELGWVALTCARVEEATELVTVARKGYESIKDVYGQAASWQALGDISKEAGDLEHAAVLLHRAEQLYATCGDRWGHASVLNSLGDVKRHGGLLSEAEALYRRASGQFRAIGSETSIYPEYNLALTLVARGEIHHATEGLERGLQRFSAIGDASCITNAHLALAVCAGARGLWIAWDDHLNEASELMQSVDAYEEDTAWIAGIAGKKAESAKEHQRAARAYRIARDVWSALEREQAVREMRAALQRVSGGPR